MNLLGLQINSVTIGAAVVVLSNILAAGARAETLDYHLLNHPDGKQASAQSGLRLDGLFGEGKTSYFSFDPADVASVLLTIVANDPAAYASGNAGLRDLKSFSSVSVPGDSTDKGSVKPLGEITHDSITTLDNARGKGGLGDLGDSITSFEEVVMIIGGEVQQLGDPQLLIDLDSTDYPEIGEPAWLTDGDYFCGFDVTLSTPVMATLVPLPPAAWMACIGLIGAAALRRRII